VSRPRFASCRRSRSDPPAPGSATTRSSTRSVCRASCWSRSASSATCTTATIVGRGRSPGIFVPGCRCRTFARTTASRRPTRR
jgi:hypothetical protein